MSLGQVPEGQAVRLLQFASASPYSVPQKSVLTTGDLDGAGDGLVVGVPVTGFMVGAELVVGLSVGCGPESVGATVGASVTHSIPA